MSSHITGQDVLDAANATAEVRFQELFETDLDSGIFSRMGEEVPTDAKSGEVDFLGAMPVLQKWVGPKKPQTTRAYEHTYSLEQYEATIEEKKFNFRYDRLGLISRRIARFQDRQMYWREKLVFDELVTNPTGYDDVSLFSASHPHGPSGATQSNTTTSALSVSTLNTAMVAGAELQDEAGEPLGISYDLMVVGPKLAKPARQLTGSERLVGISNAGALDATSNVVGGARMPNHLTGGMMDVLVWPRLTGTYDDYWYLFDTSKGVPAMLLFVGRSLEWIPQTNPDGEAAFVNGIMRWGVEADADPIAGAWQVAYAGIL